MNKNNEILFIKANDIIAYNNLENDKCELANTKTDGLRKKSFNLGNKKMNKQDNSANTNGNGNSNGNDSVNIKLITPTPNSTTENQLKNINSNIILNKGLKTTKNKNSFRFSSTKNDFYRSKNLVYINYTNNSEKNSYYQSGDQSTKQSCYLGNKKEQKRPQNKTKLNQYTSLLERKDILIDNTKLRPSASAKILKENPPENHKTFFRSPTSISIPSLIEDPKKNIKNKTTSAVKIENIDKYQCFLPKATTNHKGTNHCNIKNCLECFFLKNNFSKSTRNSGNTTQLGLYFKNKSKIKK